MKNIRSFLGSVANSSRTKINSDLSQLGVTQAFAGDTSSDPILTMNPNFIRKLDRKIHKKDFSMIQY